MSKVTQSVNGEAGMELHLSGLRVLVLNPYVCFPECRWALGDQENPLDSQTGNPALEFLNVLYFLSHRHHQRAPYRALGLSDPARRWSPMAHMGRMVQFSVLFIASDLELPKTQGNVFLICLVNNADPLPPTQI